MRAKRADLRYQVTERIRDSSHDPAQGWCERDAVPGHPLSRKKTLNFSRLNAPDIGVLGIVEHKVVPQETACSFETNSSMRCTSPIKVFSLCVVQPSPYIFIHGSV
jgi:hypothetical protein